MFMVIRQYCKDFFSSLFNFVFFMEFFYCCIVYRIKVEFNSNLVPFLYNRKTESILSLVRFNFNLVSSLPSKKSDEVQDQKKKIIFTDNTKKTKVAFYSIALNKVVRS